MTDEAPKQVKVSRSTRGNDLRLALSNYVKSIITWPVDEWEFSYSPDGPRLDFDTCELRPDDDKQPLYLLAPGNSSGKKRTATVEGGSPIGEGVAKKQRGTIACCVINFKKYGYS
jgi:hypothetical protein